ncbi:MAG: hypothetical protein OXB88_09155 [Bacteriovoracales bacterium]|nr:hypothetical protein [Bacteriovoracales bacterium]
MKKIVICVLTLVILSIPALSLGNTESKKKRSVNFSDSLVEGKYSLSGEAVITVEADKVFSSLLRPKKNFNKRIKRSAKR